MSERDSMLAQAIADREGPRVDVRAEVTQMVSSRRLRAHFHVEDDAYVLIGQVDASGTVRIVFPSDPRDDGFVRGGKSYETAEFFAGFNDEFRYNYANYTRYYGVRPNAYDGLTGYLFIVASWRPMHFEKFSTNGDWDSFDLVDQQSLRDPKPAVYELAALLAGDNREAYTVKFANYTNTLDYTPYSYGNASSLGLCYGYGYSGWSGFGAFSPFGIYSIAASGAWFDYGSDFSYRGTNYLYSAAGDCYYAQPLYYGGSPFSVATLPPTSPTKSKWSIDAINRHPGQPSSPRTPTTGRLGPAVAQDADPGTQTSSTYRQRGLLTEDDGNTLPGRRGPRTDPMDRGITHPTIQQMVEHHLADGENNNSRAAFRGQPGDATNRGWAARATQPNGYNPPRERAEASGYRGGSSGSTGSTGSSGYSGTRSAPADVSRGSSSTGGGGAVGGGSSRSTGSTSSSTGTSTSTSTGSSSGSSGGGSPVKPPR